jgi:protein tyrosine phosphatase
MSKEEILKKNTITNGTIINVQKNLKKEKINVKITDVWDFNLDEEMEHIQKIVEDYPFISMVK